MEQVPLSSVLETTKQDKECSRNTIHETSIWTKSMLIALDNGVKGGKWFSLIDKVYSLLVLFAWCSLDIFTTFQTDGFSLVYSGLKSPIPRVVNLAQQRHTT